MLWHNIERLKSLFGRSIIKRTGSATLIGEQREGGYYYLKSTDLPGFTFLLAPEEASDIEKLSDAIKPALAAYLIAYCKFQDKQAKQQIRPWISYADLRGLREGKPMNLIAELCGP
jgi:hypothetical protein